MGKTPPKEEEAEGSPRKKAPRLDDAARMKPPLWRLPAAVPLPQVPKFSKLIVEGAKRASDEKRCKCNHVDELNAIKEVCTSINSKDTMICYSCWRDDKNRIVRARPEKSDILICVTCLDHLCCGTGSIAYPFGHSRAHALKEKHWFAVLYYDPERGYCFTCNAEVKTAVKYRKGVDQKLLAPPPSVGKTGVEVNPKKVEMTGKVQAESQPSGVGLDLGDKWQGYAIRGIPNCGNTCYMSAVLQCLFVLGKLRERMLAPDCPKGLLPEVLKELFVETSAAGVDVLDPSKVLRCVGLCKTLFFQVGAMENSHELLTALCSIWKDGEKVFHRQSDAPTVINSIFGFKMLQTLSCKNCGLSLTPQPFLDLKLDFPSKWHPTKSAASPQTSEGQITLQLEVDSTQAQRISQTKDVVQSPLQIQKGKSVDSLTEDSISIEDFLLLFSEGDLEWCCSYCGKDQSASQSKNGEQIVGSSKTLRFTTLPPVLTLHLNRTSMADNNVGVKISCHVRFMEYLDVERFMDLSSLDKGSTLYRLAGVVEHIGEGSLKSGHYNVYVKARLLLGNQQEGSSCSSSWFRADDHRIRQVTLEQVLNSEAYILFYERMEGQDISGDDDADDDRCCDHVPTDSAHKDILSWSLLSDDAGTCKDCRCDAGSAGGRILVCLECGRHSCGDSWSYIPYGHAWDHAKQEQHWVAALFDNPQTGFCFKCECERPIYPEPDDDELGTIAGEIHQAGAGGGKAFRFDMPIDLAAGFLDLGDANARGYAIRGIPNQGNTCYMSAVLQCLFVLGKLQERMLALDRPESKLAKALKKLFVEASAAGNVLNPTDVLERLWSGEAPFSRPGAMEDSHELLMALRDIWKEGESDDPTMMDSIFKFQMTQTKSCRKCGHSSGQKIDDFCDLTVHFPSKWHPTKSAASPQTSESPRSRKREIAVQLFPADVQRNLEKMQTVSESAYSHAIGSEVIVEETHKPLEVDSTQAQNISQSKDDVHSPVQIQEGKSVDSLTKDPVSVEDLLLLFSEGPIEWSCPDCGKDHEEPSASRSKNGGQRVGSGNEDNVGDTVQMYRFTTLPPVLTLHLNRTSYQKRTPMVGNKDDNTVAIKISVHVRFMEYLDVERFMDRSSVDKGSTLYRLAGVVEHIGEGSLKSGHYIAYTRARRLGNQQEGSSCSSSWFRADDHRIRQVTLEQVLNSEAYILFYERMEGQDISGT